MGVPTSAAPRATPLTVYHAAIPARAHECICHLRCEASVEREAGELQRDAALVRPALIEERLEFAPNRVTRGVAHQDAVLDEPRGLAATPRPHRHFDTVLLHVGAGSEHQSAPRHRADAIVLAPLEEPLPVGGLALLDPSLTELSVLERFQRRHRPLRRLPRCGDVAPRSPAIGLYRLDR